VVELRRRGYATTVTRLRHWVPDGKAEPTDREFAETATWLILPMHDAVVIECALEDVNHVAERATVLKEHAVRCLFLCLKGKVSVNKSKPHCWNKDGDAESLSRLIEGSGE
jgi:hypothetical protein